MNLSLIQAIETTTFCTRTCSWCLNTNLLNRHMTDAVFLKSMTVLEEFPPTLIAMNGCGDPLCDPDIVARVGYVAQLGYKPRIITNGDLLDRDMLRSLSRAGMESLMISPHGDVSELIDMAKKLKIKVVDGYSPVQGGRTHNWASQQDTPNELKALCNPIIKGRGYINVDGYITQCCLDYSAKHPIGHVNDDNLHDIQCRSIPLCAGCEGSP